MTASAAPNEIDRYIGQRIRARRLVLAMTQKQLADKLGLTFQQIQKYEKGIDRVSCSRLHQITIALDASPAIFFPPSGDVTAVNDGMSTLIDRPDTIRMLRAFSTVRGRPRAMLIEIVEAYAHKSLRNTTNTKEWWRNVG